MFLSLFSSYYFLSFKFFVNLSCYSYHCVLTINRKFDFFCVSGFCDVYKIIIFIDVG